MFFNQWEMMEGLIGVGYFIMARLFKSFEFGNGSRMSDENLDILEISPEQKMLETSCKKC